MRRGTWFVLVSAFFWGTTFPAVTYGLTAGGLHPVAFLYYRFAVATVALVGFAVWKNRFRIGLFGDWRILGIAAMNTIGYLLQFWAQERTTATKTALLVNVNVLVTALVAYALLKERPHRGTWWGLGFGALGVVLLTTNGDLSAVRFSNAEFVGDLMAFGTGLSWTVTILAVKHYLNRNPSTDAVAMNVVVFVATTLLLVPLALATDAFATGSNLAGLAVIVYTGIFPTAVAFVLWQKGLQETGAAVSSILLLFETIIALLLSVWLLGEDVGLWAGVGAGLILGALYLASRGGSTPSPEPSASPAASGVSGPSPK